MSRITNDHGFAGGKRWPRNLDNDLESLVTANELTRPIARVLQLLNNRFTATIISNIALFMHTSFNDAGMSSRKSHNEMKLSSRCKSINCTIDTP